MVVVPQPSVKGCSALATVAVDRAVGPAAEHRADEALGLAICLRSVGAGPQVTDAESATGDRVDLGSISAAVVGQQLLDGHAVALVERDCPPQERHDGASLLV